MKGQARAFAAEGATGRDTWSKSASRCTFGKERGRDRMPKQSEREEGREEEKDGEKEECQEGQAEAEMSVSDVMSFGSKQKPSERYSRKASHVDIRMTAVQAAKGQKG